MEWKENFKEGKELVLATSSKECRPNANIVISLGFVDNKLLVADCEMKSTIENLKENNRICVIGGYYRITGSVEIFSSGKYFDLCVQKNEEYDVKNAILISIEDVFDLDNMKKIL
ncbi:MAG: pyridoxamine 5'-phosphate oxidase family protein [Nanoarchaeota archaeon]|nr:pyridoxamine 5'-phosphate oxidase family protein [Nanoarchaeota archaeon]